MATVNEDGGITHPVIVKSLVWSNEAATQQFARALARSPALRQAYVELAGELGAGKTTLVRYLLQDLGEEGLIKSPTYAMVEEYELPSMMAWHFDFFRFKAAYEWEDAGFREIFATPGLKLAEWANRVSGLAPAADLVIAIEVAPNASRQITLQAQSATGLALLTAVFAKASDAA